MAIPSVAVELVRSSGRSTMTMAVIVDERANINALAVRTALRASETPVRREITTKMFNGTRNKEES
jgi:hypothetical protein